MSETIMAGYLGDVQKKLVHHLGNMKSNCGIYYIKTKNRKYFEPDTLQQAMKEGFHSCSKCIKNE
jgi:hypothetical protein